MASPRWIDISNLIITTEDCIDEFEEVMDEQNSKVSKTFRMQDGRLILIEIRDITNEATHDS